MARTDTLPHFLTDVADAIREKTGSTDTITASDFDTEIENIPSGGDPSEYFNTNPTAEELATPNYWGTNNFVKKAPDLIIPDNISDINYLFSKNSFAPKIIFNDNITKITRLFSENSAKNIDVSGMQTKNVTNIAYLFYLMENLEEIDLTNLDFRNVSNTSSASSDLLGSCGKLTKAVMPILLPNHNRALYRCFVNVYSLKTLVIKSNFVVAYNNTFGSCYHMDGTVNATYNPQGLKDGRIYVPDALVNDYKAATNWANYGDQILPLSEYVEEN